MNRTIEQIRALVGQSRSDEAVEAANEVIARGGADMATALYLRGNAYRQKGDWRRAMNDYLAAIDLDPDGPATLAYRQAQEVLNFYDHDLYNP